MKEFKFFKKVIVFSTFAGIILLAACTDVTKEIGSNFVEDDPNIDLFKSDTFTIEAYSIGNDSLVTSKSDVLLLGSINDPHFGKVNSSLFCNFMLSSGFDSAFINAQFFDSVSVILAYSKNYFGDTSAALTFRLHELTEALTETDSTYYYSSSEIAYDPAELASVELFPAPNVKESDNDSYAHIKIKITDSENHPFAQKFIGLHKDEYMTWDEDSTYEYIDAEKFYEYFKGFFIAVDDVNPADTGLLLSFYPHVGETKILIAKHDTTHSVTSGGTDTVLIVDRSSSMVISSNTGVSFSRNNHFDFQDAPTELQEQVVNNNKEFGKEKLFIQSIGGPHIRIKIPHIDDFLQNNKKIAINNAELVFNIDQDYVNETFLVPTNIYPQQLFTNDSIAGTIDYNYFGTNFVGGFQDTTNNEYRIRITRYIQELIEGNIELNDGLDISSLYDITAYQRVVFIGTEPSLPVPFSQRARLEITYSLIDE